MHPLFGLLGLLLVVLAITDLLWTTFLEGAGPLATRLASWIGRAVLAVHSRQKRRRAINLSGLLTVWGTLVAWGLLFWFGWALIFCASPTAVVSADTRQPADFWARVYFAGYTISTVGLGDYKPLGGFWQMAVALAGGSGFILFGLAIAYIVPVVQAATSKRQLAVCVWALGRSPSDIIIRAWNGADTTALGPHLVSLTAMLAMLGESHLTYPVLHYFHGTKRTNAVAAGVASLDEALTILECGLQKGCSLDLPALGAARESITVYLQTLAPALITPGRDVPPSPSLQELREVGVPVVDDALFDAALAGLTERRRLLLALVPAGRLDLGRRLAQVAGPGPQRVDGGVSLASIAAARHFGHKQPVPAGVHAITAGNRAHQHAVARSSTPQQNAAPQPGHSAVFEPDSETTKDRDVCDTARASGSFIFVPSVRVGASWSCDPGSPASPAA